MSLTHHNHAHHDHAHQDHTPHDHAHHHVHKTVGGSPALWRRLIIACAAIALVIAIGCLIGVLIGSPAPTPTPKSPFGMGLREGGAATTGLAAWILDIQSQFSRAMTAAVRAFKTDVWAGLTLVGVAFAYGVFHAAGPGHGKAIIAAYAVATEKQIKGGIALALGAALLQALVAIVIVGIFAVIFGATAKTMVQAANWVEIASFALVALVGGWLLWVKSGTLATMLAAPQPPHHHDHHRDHHHHHHLDHQHDRHHDHHHHAHGEACGCGHDHAPLPPERTTWKSMAATIVAAGIRPCSGAIVVLVFALSQSVFWLGILATFAMAMGTFLTTAMIAIFTLVAKKKARQLAGGEESRRGQLVASGLETLAAAAVLCLGIVLMTGFAAA